jgi:hypothetical protein
MSNDLQISPERLADPGETAEAHSAWITFVHDNRHSLNHIQKSEGEERSRALSEPESKSLNETLSVFWAALVYPPSTSDVPYHKDIQHMKKIVDAIMEARRDETLTESETLELMKFFISKFIERRVNRAMGHFLPTDESKKGWFYRTRNIFQ